MADTERYISATQARRLIAEHLQAISPTKMTNLVKHGEIPAQRDPIDQRKLRMKESDVMRWIEGKKREMSIAA